MNLPQ